MRAVAAPGIATGCPHGDCGLNVPPGARKNKSVRGRKEAEGPAYGRTGSISRDVAKFLSLCGHRNCTFKEVARLVPSGYCRHRLASQAAPDLSRRTSRRAAATSELSSTSHRGAPKRKNALSVWPCGDPLGTPLRLEMTLLGPYEGPKGYIHVCVYTHIYIYIYIHVISLSLSLSICLSLSLSLSLSLYTYICIYAYTYIARGQLPRLPAAWLHESPRALLYIYIYICMHISLYIYIYIYIYYYFF